MAWESVRETAPWMLWVLGPMVVGLLFGLRYVVFAGAALALTHVFRKPLAARRLQPVPFTRAQLVREFTYSMLTTLVFAAVAVAAVAFNRATGAFQLYYDIDAYGWAWFWLSIPAGLLVHDFYFYWTHRFMHLPQVYERVHEWHHRSTNPSPLAAFAFHPLEAVIEAGGFIAILLIVPIHPLAFLAVSFIMIAMNVMGHLGYELLPRGFAQSPLSNWFNTATSHNQHHRTYSYNYGLYTLIWDRLFGTLHPRYEDTFARATASPR